MIQRLAVTALAAATLALAAAACTEPTDAPTDDDLAAERAAATDPDLTAAPDPVSTLGVAETPNGNLCTPAYCSTRQPFEVCNCQYGNLLKPSNCAQRCNSDPGTPSPE